jgi:hypothetical protein
MSNKPKKQSRYRSDTCRTGQCGHAHHAVTVEQAEVLAHVRSQRSSEGWRNGARVGNRPRI